MIVINNTVRLSRQFYNPFRIQREEDMNVFWGVSMLLYRGVRFILAAVFLWSGITKLLDPMSFGILIDAYGLIPKTWVMPAAILFSSLEVIAGAGLVLNIHGSLAIITGMMVLFIAILSYGIHIGLDIDCGCFGPQAPEAKAFQGLRMALYRDVMLMTGVLYLYSWRFYRSIRPDPVLEILHPLHAIKGELQMKKLFGKLMIGTMILGLTTFAHAFGKDKFEEELEKEQGAVKLVREVQRGGYDVVTTEELKKRMCLSSTPCPMKTATKKSTSPGQNNSCFRFQR
jgi:uncharacterized membrane protein YphA (DoxX/SURF4 family)